jgi:hypothetical protein
VLIDAVHAFVSNLRNRGYLKHGTHISFQKSSQVQHHESHCNIYMRVAEKSLALHYGIEKNVFTLHIPPSAPHTYDFVVLTSLTHPRKIILFMLQIGK